MTIEHFYKVDINWESGRTGTMSSPELKQTIEVATPPEFPKGVEGVWSPEHLLVAAVSSCLLTTFLSVAENSRLQFSGISINSTGRLDNASGKWMISEVVLEPVVEITDAREEARALRVLEKSDRACLISNSVKAEIVLKPRVVVTEPVTDKGL